MKLVLLHGPALVSSRLKLNQLKKTYPEDSITEFPEGSNTQDILGSLQTMPMFVEDRLIIVENPPDDLLSNYTLNPTPYTLVLWFDHELSLKKEILKYTKSLNGQILFFPEAKEVSVFPLLDLLGAKDKKAFLELDKLKKAGFDNQYLITMCFYMLRSLVSPSRNAPDFVKRKIERQKQNFSDTEIKNMYKYILELDYKIKNGLAEGAQAEFLLVSKFIAN